jgi:zinc transport system permease protein
MILAEMLALPFMQRALLAGLILGALLAGLGIFVTLRKMAFFGDGIAHASLAGIALAILLGWAPLPVALAWAVIVALLIWWLEHEARLSSDTLIGIFLTASMAIGVLLISRTAGYQPELLSYLFGNILSVTRADLGLTVVVAALIAVWLMVSLRSLTYMSLAEENAAVAGVRTRLQSALLYVALALATVLGVKTFGIILVSALLILPPATSRLLSRSFREYLINSLLVAEVTVLAGLCLSYRFDLPSGAAIVALGTGLFFVGLVGRRLLKRA